MYNNHSAKHETQKHVMHHITTDAMAQPELLIAHRHVRPPQSQKT